MSSNVFQAQINYFGALIKSADIDGVLDPQNKSQELTRELIENTLGLINGGLQREILERYVEITSEDSFLNIVPISDIVFARIVKPLRSSIRTYCLEEYESCLATSGLVCEMLSILIWEINSFSINGEELDVIGEKVFFGKPVAQLSQDRRLKVLNRLGMINDNNYRLFNTVRRSRNHILHDWSPVDNTEVKSEARQAHLNSMKIFIDLVDMKIDQGKITNVNPLLLKYISYVDDTIAREQLKNKS